MNPNRRSFLKTSVKLSSGLLLTGSAGNLLSSCASGGRLSAARENFGLQLYTLRDVISADTRNVLKQVASYGYKEIESYEGPKGMFFGMTNTEFKSYLDSLGMRIVSSHCDWTKNLEEKADRAAAIGMKYLIAPYVGPQASLDAYKAMAERFNAAGRICQQRGIRFAYHNHDYTFVPVNGTYPQDVFMQQTDAGLVDYEMDIYWVVTAGQDPAAWLRKYPNRWRLCHVKDRSRSAAPAEKDASVAVGTGSINWTELLTEARRQGMNHFIVEQEKYEGTTPLAAAKVSADYMKRLGR